MEDVGGDDDDVSGDVENGDGDRMPLCWPMMWGPFFEFLLMWGVAVVGDGARRSEMLPRMWLKGGRSGDLSWLQSCGKTWLEKNGQAGINFKMF